MARFEPLVSGDLRRISAASAHILPTSGS